MLLTRAPLTSREQVLRQCVRLACIRHAASVRPEPGSNSHNWLFELLLITILALLTFFKLVVVQRNCLVVCSVEQIPLHIWCVYLCSVFNELSLRLWCNFISVTCLLRNCQLIVWINFNWSHMFRFFLVTSCDKVYIVSCYSIHCQPFFESFIQPKLVVRFVGAVSIDNLIIIAWTNCQCQYFLEVILS